MKFVIFLTRVRYVRYLSTINAFLLQIVKSLGRTVGSGMFKCIPPEDAFLIPEIDVRSFLHLVKLFVALAK